MFDNQLSCNKVIIKTENFNIIVRSPSDQGLNKIKK